MIVNRMRVFSQAVKPPQGPPARPVPVREPVRRVSDSFEFGPDASFTQNLLAKVEMVAEVRDSLRAPGKMIGRFTTSSDRNLRRVRERDFAEELAIPVAGIKKTVAGWKADALANPDDAAGRFDPYAHMPRLVFDPREDSFPIRPDHDGDGDLLSDVDHYRHGIIGGSQPLEGSFSVAKKGDYTVLTYSLYYVDNKAGHYHRKDSSTFAVYLKPGKSGKLEPRYLYTSWHHGANMAAWDDLKKGQDGRPIITVGRGSHALRPLGRKESLPKEGVHVDGNGYLSTGGKPLPNRLRWVSPQANVENARYLSPKENRFVMDAYYGRYSERTNPIHPSLFGYA